MKQVAAVALVIVLFFAPTAGAQSYEPGDARLNALACEKLPVPLKVDVEILDNAERFLRFRDKFVATLRARGVEVADGAPLTLTLDIRTVREFEQDEHGKLLEFRAGQESGENIGREGKLYLRGNVWSNRSDSVLGGRKRDPGQLAINQLQATAIVNSRDDGRCLWQGEVLHNLRGDDADDAAERIMPILAGALGKTVRNRPVDIFANTRR